MRRLALVMLAIVPLVKHTPSMRVSIVVAARLLVACKMSSTMGRPVGVDRTVAGSTRQNSMMRIKAVPLVVLDVVLFVIESGGGGVSYVTPPTAMA